MDGTMKKFTLIELLVVISITGILSSMILPAVAKARAKGIQTFCLNNTRQVTLATISYSDDNNGLGPEEISWNKGEKWYRKLIPSYLPGNGIEGGGSIVTACPAGMEITVHHQATITMNGWISGKPNWNNSKWVPQSMHAAVSPVETSVVMDSYDTWSSIKSGNANVSYTLDADPEQRIARHQEKLNVSYIDGHAAAMTGIQFITKGGNDNNIFWHPSPP